MTMDNLEESTMSEMMEAIEKSMAPIHSKDIVKGKVISVTDNEVFVDIGYRADGIITRSELSNEEEVNPKDILKVGDEVEVYILQVNDGEGNVSLSKKRVESFKVWDELDEAAKNSTIINVKVSEVVKGGVLTYIKGIRAFIPASQISTKYVENLADFVGQTLAVKIVEFDKQKRKVVLSRKEIEKAELEAKKEVIWNSLSVGQKVKGKVCRLTKFGAFVDLGGVDGLIHVSELSWKRITDPSEVVAVGDVVEVYILELNKEKNRISLALKDVNANPWNNITEKYPIGSVAEATVVKLMDFGAFAELEPGVDGLIHVSEISEERINKPADVLKAGDKVKVKILDINEESKKISLSIKATIEKPQEDYSQYNQEEKVTMADVVNKDAE